MVAVRHADLLEAAVAAVMSEKEGRDPGGVGLKGETRGPSESDVLLVTAGIPSGISIPGTSGRPNFSARSMRRSISRTPVMYSSSLSWSLRRAGC